MVLHPEIQLQAKLNKLSGNHEFDRNNLRKIVIDKFTQEKAGHGNKELASKYKYIVESLQNGNHIYLTRPVPLNKGFDFIIHVQNTVFINGKDNPKHEDILDDLKRKRQNWPDEYKLLLSAIDSVYLCNDPTDITLESSFITNNHGLHQELLLKVIKWLFIEQDIRYWNWSGRTMFMKAILNL